MLQIKTGTIMKKNYILIIWIKLKNLFSRNKKAEEPRSTPVQDIPTEIIEIAEGAQLPEALSSGNQKLPGKMVVHCWLMGFKDGKNHQPQAKPALFHQTALGLRSRLLPNITGELAKNKKEYEAQEAEFNEAASLLKKIQGYIDEIVTRRALNPEKFSKRHMWVYIIASAILLIADVPLSLMVTEHVFDTESYEGHSIANLFSFDAEYDVLGCSGFFAHAGQVLVVNWQIVLMALGIVLSAIFFKMAYEELMLTPLDRSAGLIRNLNKFEQEMSPEEKKRRSWSMFAIRAFRFAVVLVILGGIFWTLYKFGTVRFEVEQAISESKAGKNISEEFFLAISILFPLLSGICFAIASHISNMRRLYKYAEEKYEGWRKKVGALKSRLLDLEAKIASLNHLVKKYEANEYDVVYERLFSEAYQHGYLRGMFANQGQQPYEQASRSFEQFITLREIETLNRKDFNSDN
jgi:hypothetical protein